MKRAIGAVMFVSLVGGLCVTVSGAEKKSPPPQTLKITLPSGETVDADRIPGAPTGLPPDGTEIIVKGVVKTAFDTVKKQKDIVVETETGQKYVPINAAYVNTLRSKAFGKTVKLQGVSVRKTSFNNYPGIVIKDILEIK